MLGVFGDPCEARGDGGDLVSGFSDPIPDSGAELVEFIQKAPLKKVEALLEESGVRESLSPTLALQRLTPFKTIDLPGQTIYYFLKVGAKAGTSLRSLNPAIARQCAVLTLHRADGTFTLQWFPHQEEAQVFVKMNVSELPTVVNDLRQAGFA